MAPSCLGDVAIGRRRDPVRRCSCGKAASSPHIRHRVLTGPPGIRTAVRQPDVRPFRQADATTATWRIGVQLDEPTIAQVESETRAQLDPGVDVLGDDEAHPNHDHPWTPQHTRKPPLRFRVSRVPTWTTWRRRWDSNPRTGCPVTALAGPRTRPDYATSPRRTSGYRLAADVTKLVREGSTCADPTLRQSSSKAHRRSVNIRPRANPAPIASTTMVACTPPSSAATISPSLKPTTDR